MFSLHPGVRIKDSLRKPSAAKFVRSTRGRTTLSRWFFRPLLCRPSKCGHIYKCVEDTADVHFSWTVAAATLDIYSWRTNGPRNKKCSREHRCENCNRLTKPACASIEDRAPSEGRTKRKEDDGDSIPNAFIRKRIDTASMICT